jgi:hypothetical protein
MLSHFIDNCAESYYAGCRYAECHYAKCHYAECHYAECHYAECRYGECRYAEYCSAKNLWLFLTPLVTVSRIQAAAFYFYMYLFPH